MAESIQFDTGLIEFNLNGKKTVYFNPTDYTFIERLFSAGNTLDELEAVYDEKKNAVEDNAAFFDVGREYDAKIREVLNGIFDDDICTPCFGTLKTFSMADGLPVWANLLYALVDKIDSQFIEESRKTNPRLDKYVKKYESRRKK